MRKAVPRILFYSIIISLFLSPPASRQLSPQCIGFHESSYESGFINVEYPGYKTVVKNISFHGLNFEAYKVSNSIHALNLIPGESQFIEYGKKLSQIQLIRNTKKENIIKRQFFVVAGLQVERIWKSGSDESIGMLV